MSASKTRFSERNARKQRNHFSELKKPNPETLHKEMVGRPSDESANS